VAASSAEPNSVVYPGGFSAFSPNTKIAPVERRESSSRQIGKPLDLMRSSPSAAERKRFTAWFHWRNKGLK
jgi:hypothetical protein